MAPGGPRQLAPIQTLSANKPFSPPHTRTGTPYGSPDLTSRGGERDGSRSPAPMFPLCQASPPDLGPDGQPFMVYVPFSTSDLYNWKNQNPSFSQNPQGLISLLESVFFTHQPTWDHCQQLLQTLFTSEEREKMANPPQTQGGSRLSFHPEGRNGITTLIGEGRLSTGAPGNAKCGGKPVDFLIDTGATFSVLQHPAGPVSKDRTPIQGATGRVKSYPWTQARIANLGKKTVTHSFRIMPGCPYPLLGSDRLSKLQATISFEGGEPQVLLQGPENQEKTILLLTCPLEEEYKLHEGPSEAPPQDPCLVRLREEILGVWVEGNPPGLAAHRPPIVIQLTSIATPVRVRQYPMSQKVKIGIAKHILRLTLCTRLLFSRFLYSNANRVESHSTSECKRLREAGILIPCQLAWNTPLFPVLKPGTEDFRPVQDLREVNKRVETIHPMVPNSYTLLSLLQPEHRYYAVLDLKDAFFSLPLAPQSQPIFAFEWTDPEEGKSGQLTWTRLPQGFKNSPTLFDEALNQDLKEYRHSHPGITLLQYVDDLLLATGDREKCQQTTRDLLVTLDQLGYRVSAKKAQLCSTKVTYLGYNIKEGKRTLSNGRVQAILSIPTPKTKWQTLDPGSYGHNPAEMAKPLYSATGGKNPGLSWTNVEEKVLQKLKQALASAPALALPGLTKPFQLYVAESQGVAKGVLTKLWGPGRGQLPTCLRGWTQWLQWPGCLKAVAAMAILVKEASKLTFGQDLQVVAPHTVETLLHSPPERWLSNARITQYQVLLLDPLRVSFLKTTALNPAILLPNEGIKLSSITTSPSPTLRRPCSLTGAALWKTVSDMPGSCSYTRKSHMGTIPRTWDFSTEGRTHSPHPGLMGGKDKRISTRTVDMPLPHHLGPKEVAVIHCKGHQKDNSPVTKGNQFANKTAKETAKRPVGPLEVLAAIPTQNLEPNPRYTPRKRIQPGGYRRRKLPTGGYSYQMGDY
ncbi:hypothetical protein QTO34_004160 [Cnephaeus nilssonii]|uniref:Uncharacterized protein n=1 Tax=Cnephaeus nilssonii TaxID=3371016 RepID=A0AA40HS06_CNENI|nr:hypothetical protein QTO34_004160 [Eptesicus nilssonii]